MVEQRPSGWYDDPQDDDNLRYWDGVMWTEHVASKRSQYQPGPISEPAAGASAQQWAAYQQQQGYAGQAPQDRRTGGVEAGTGSDARLAGWWRRVGAMIVDTLLVGLVSLPITLPRISSSSDAIDAWFTQVMAAAEAGTTAPLVPESILADLAFVGLVQTVVYIALEVFLLSRWGVTPGRRLTGIRVRPVGVDEPVPLAVGLRRTIVKTISNLLSGVPLLSSVSFMFQMADYLWPLPDKGNQSLHDKVGGTEVVRGKALSAATRHAQQGPGQH